MVATTRQRIVIGAETYPPDVNGAANFAYRLATGLANRGHDVHVICPSPGPTPQRFTADAVTVHQLASHDTPWHPTFRVCLPWQIGGPVANLLHRLRPDVVHVQSHFVVCRAVTRAARRGRIPVVATNHFMPENIIGFLKLPARASATICRILWRDAIHVLGRAQIVTAPTPRAVRLLHHHGLPTIALPVSCGLDLRRFAQPTIAKPIPANRILFVGRLDAEKNVHELLHAIALLPEQLAVTADIVGDGSRRAHLEALARHLDIDDRLTFHGLVNDQELLRAYAQCDVFCMPGTAELQSLATMEAMAAGKPVIAADAMALPELVHPGHNGHLYPPGDIPALAAALTAVLTSTNTRTRMGEASRHIIARHDLDHTLDTFESLYRLARLRHPTPDQRRQPDRTQDSRRHPHTARSAP